MVWEPINLYTTCPANSTLTACSPFGYAYLDLLVRLFGRSSDRYPHRPDHDVEEYDFIVVGAGSAGCIVANRLSANPNWKVLLLEAGPEEPDITKPPSMEYVILGTDIDWQYFTQPDGRTALARTGQRCQWPKGKTMGGSSAVNSLAYVRGNRLDFDNWAKMGNSGWSYKEVLPYFRKSEQNLNIGLLSRKYHGIEGEQPVSFFPYVDSPTKMLIKGMNELGLPVLDINGECQEGVFNAQAFSKNGERVSSNHAFIRPVINKRNNLIVKTNAEATKILINENKVAYGVQYIRNGKEFIAKASKEVTVCGGVINSPKLLLLSGIGPADDLKDAGIKVIQDLPVGKNLQDHVTFYSFLIAVPNNNTLVCNYEILKDIIDYSNGNRQNPLAGDGVGKAMGFIKTDKNLPAPDIQYQFQSIRIEEYNKDIIQYSRINTLPVGYYNGIGVRVMNLTPKSYGYLKLNKTNIHGKPIIVPNYLKNPVDFVPLVKGSQFIFNLEHTEAFKKLGAKFYKEPLEACKEHQWGTKDYTICLIQKYTDTTYHQVGTCKMGPDSDRTAVVDPKLRVYGVKSLRVMDSAAIPIIPRVRWVSRLMKMLWQPLDLNTTCPANTTLAACSPFGFAYLDLLVRLFGRSSDRYPCRPDHDVEEYDFIVVGAGAAGCIVANRLSAFPDWRVLLLEAGPEEPDVSKAPAFEYVTLASSIDWQYNTQPDGRSCLARVGQKCSWPRGKTMGGTTSVNSLAYVRGNRLDFDTWAEMGNHGWSYKEILPYFKKSEQNHNIGLLSPKFHGTEGEQHISFLPYVDSPTKMLIKGIHELGLPVIDINGEYQEGVMNLQAFSKNGERVSSNHAFIRPIINERNNLIVKTNAEATKILINENKVAYGVKYIRNGKEFIAKATKEVILCGGVINSPKLLLLSGIGPADDLKDAGIDEIQDLPVGKNLQDHPTFYGFLITIPNNNTLVSNDEILKDINDYFNGNRQNPIAGDGLAKATSFIKTDKNLPAPNVQYHFQDIRIEEFIKDIKQYIRINPLPVSYYNSIGVRVMNLTPKSRGYLKLNTTNPHDKPIIFGNYLKDPEDFVALVKGSEFIFNLEHTEAFKKAGAKFYKEPLEACKEYQWGSKDYTICLARQYTDTSHHQVGTCKMGPDSDKTAVVDPKLRVYGVKSLRVMDSAAIPIVPRGNTNAASMLMGERGAEFVINDWTKEKH
ncbi:hypothetical protein K1T71_012707 [Dendrolimus kikuchii]|uniref:Uncharacterized protein n=1 Tax=Dendrolimus kikuchii TaxID=765133 RepID=A0ACC1CK36_9NEOP|nr:hypothetical protein K1T71_012707 [Dendrolimus kikuchii]